MLNQFTSLQLYSISKVLDLRFKYLNTETSSNVNCLSPETPSVLEVIKQKLLDAFYCVEDSKSMHGVVLCQSNFKECENLASTFCSNHLCKLCCQVTSPMDIQILNWIQDTQHREPCVIHDSYDQFFRHKIKSLYLFEQTHNFDPKRTLRIFFRKLVRKHDLEKAFKGRNIDWEKIAIYHHPVSHRIHCVYLPFVGSKDAFRVYTERKIYAEQLGKNLY